MDLSIHADWFVNPRVLGDFYRSFKDRSAEEIRSFSFQQGLSVGRMVMKQAGITGNGIPAIATLLRVVLKDEPTATVNDLGSGKLLLRNAGFCPLMTACLSMDLPWTWLCSVLGWPFFHGLASAVNPGVNLSMMRRREKGDPCCDHVFEIGQGKLILP